MHKLELRGTALQRGLLQGEALRKPIQELSEIRRHLVRGFLKESSLLKIDELALKQVAVLRSWPEVYDEFIGIAEGANVSLGDLAILNNYTDMRDFTFSPLLQEEDQEEGGCSVFSVKDKSRLNVCGQTWDMHASAQPYILHLSLKEGVQAEILTLTGCLALSGVNEFGVCVLINNVHCRETHLSIIWSGLVRGMLRQKSAAMAFEYLKKNIPSSGHNYLIVDAQESFNVETTGKRFELTEHVFSSGVSFHTNHYLGSLVSEEILERRSKTSVQRLECLQTYFAKGAFSLLSTQELMEELLGSRNEAGISISPSTEKHASATCGGLYFDFQKKNGEIFSGLYTENDRVQFQF